MSTENLHIPINTSTGTATTSLQLNKVYTTQLAQRAKIVSSNQEVLYKELDQIKKALWACKFPPLALKQLQQRFITKHNKQPRPQS